jgi:hypothetical protein
MHGISDRQSVSLLRGRLALVDEGTLTVSQSLPATRAYRGKYPVPYWRLRSVKFYFGVEE